MFKKCFRLLRFKESCLYLQRLNEYYAKHGNKSAVSK